MGADAQSFISGPIKCYPRLWEMTAARFQRKKNEKKTTYGQLCTSGEETAELGDVPWPLVDLGLMWLTLAFSRQGWATRTRLGYQSKAWCMRLA